MQRTTMAAAIALLFSTSAIGQDADLAKIRDEIRQLKESYERRIETLEKRLAAAEKKAAQAETTATNAATTAVKAEQTAAKAEAAGSIAPVAAAPRSTESAFNPAISLILQGTAASLSQDPNRYQITGFTPTGAEVQPPRRGFGLGETELMVSGNIDAYFRGSAILALTPDNQVEVEESYFETLALPAGFKVKAGRFYSGIGYLNEIHQHAWDFQDAPLVYKAFLGRQLGQDGIQLKWIAPTDLFMEFGAEFAQGDSFPGSDRNKNGIGGSSVFARLGGDIGTDYAWRAGLSGLRMQPTNRTYQDTDALGGTVSNAFTGSANVYGIDGVLKWAPNGNASSQNFKLQGEYFRMRQDGTLTYDDTAQAAPQFGAAMSDYYRSRQSGYYVQGVWQFMPRWRTGYRYDALRYGSIDNGIVANGLGPAAADFPVLAPHNPTRSSWMIDWSPTEFSRLRLQLASDKSRAGVTDNQVMLQYIHSLGAHGAHRF